MKTIINTAPKSPPVTTLAGFSADVEKQNSSGKKYLSWKEIKRVIDKVHRHVCGHSP